MAATATLRVSGALPAAGTRTPSSTPARKGAVARFVDRMIEARLRKAEAEVRHYHRHLLPDELDRKLGNLPFAR
jgi:hypothetical protein